MNRRNLIVGATALAACGPAESQAPTPAPFPMRRGVNLGNALEAPNEGDWGYRIEAEHLRAIADAGFDGIRLPVRWDQHLDRAGRIAPLFLARVREVVAWALERDLMVQLDVHHFDALIANPARERGRFLALWGQIGEAFADAPPSLFFEPLNEPHGPQWDGARLIDLQSETVTLLRESNPTRLIVLGPGNWQNINALANWTPPEADNIAVSVHYYEPYAFTHQNAEWLGADAPRFDRDWGTGDDRVAVRAHIEQAAAWGARFGYAVQLGEFGVNRAVPIQQRSAWTRAVREQCEAQGIGWCVWDFAGAFPVWDAEADAIRPLMRDALFS